MKFTAAPQPRYNTECKGCGSRIFMTEPRELFAPTGDSSALYCIDCARKVVEHSYDQTRSQNVFFATT